MSQDLNVGFSEQFSSDLSSAMDTVFASSAPPTPEGETSPAPSPGPDLATAAPGAPSEGVVPAPAFSDDTVIDILVNGVSVPKTLKQLKSEGMMHEAFTQKTQALAAERRQMEADRQAAQEDRQEALRMQAQLRSIANDKSALSALYLKLHGQDSAAVPDAQGMPAPQARIDPDQLAEFLTPRVQERVMQQIALKQQQAATIADVETFTHGLLAADPVLQALGPTMADTIYAQVASLQPKDAAEAKELIRLQIETTTEAIRKVTGNTAKAAAVAKAQAADAVQRGGSPVLPQKREYESLSDEHMTADMEAYVAQLTAR